MREFTPQEIAEQNLNQPVIFNGTRPVMTIMGADTGLWHRWDEKGWSAWTSLGGQITSGPSATKTVNGWLTVFARGIDNALWHKWYDNGWSAWTGLGGHITSAPSAIVSPQGRLMVFARAADNTLTHRYYDNGWSEWTGLGGHITSAPSAIVSPQERLMVFARAADNTLTHKYYDNGWSEWTGLGGQLTSAPCAVISPQGRLMVFARGADNALTHTWYDNGWSAWKSLGGVITSSPSAGRDAEGRLIVYARGTDGAVFFKRYTDRWSEWETFGRTDPMANGNSVIIYSDANFLGTSKVLSEGEYDSNALGIGNDQLSSLIVGDGLHARVYQHPGFAGAIFCLSGGRAGLINDSFIAFPVRNFRMSGDGRYAYIGQGSNFNDQASSIVVERGVTLHQDAHFKGDSVSLPVGDYTADSDQVMNAFKAWKAAPSGRFRGPWPLLLENDSCSSILVPEGFCVTLCRDGLAGNGGEIPYSATMNAAYNDQISAIKVRRAVVIYEHSNYKGAWANLKPGDYPNAAALRLANDSMSSIRVPPGLIVRLYEGDNFQGASIVVEGDMPNIANGLNDRVSSAKVSPKGVPAAPPVGNGVADEG